METDAPYVRPSWCTDPVNTSLVIPALARELAEIRGIQPEEVEQATTENFGLFTESGADIRPWKIALTVSCSYVNVIFIMRNLKTVKNETRKSIERYRNGKNCGYQN